MKHLTFEEYLAERHATGYTGTDDSMPDAFDNWLAEFDVDTIMEYAEAYGKMAYERGKVSVTEDDFKAPNELDPRMK